MRDAAKADLAKQQASAPSATAPKSSAPPTTGRPTKTGEGDLAGLTIKEGDVHAEGSKVSPKIIDIAKQVQASLPNFAYFSGFNDKFHQEKSPSSSHTSGKAMDFALSQPPSIEEGQEISKYLKSMGASVVIDEYNFPSSKATAGHIHAQIPGYADGGVASTPQIAMVAEKGPEAMIPLDNGAIPIKIKLSDALSTPTFAGMNEYAGYNQGPMSTDLSAVKSIAEAVGAFDKVSQTITDPKMWKDILSSGLATNYQLGEATLGTQGIPGLGNDIAERLKEIKEQTNTDSESALKLVADEFKSAMASMSQQLAQMVGNQNEGGMSGLASLMQELVTATKNGVDVQEKILRVQQ
jgi:Sec-independent protein translocase protein TatA